MQSLSDGSQTVLLGHTITHMSVGGVIKYHRLYCYDKCISIKGYDDGFIKAMNLV